MMNRVVITLACCALFAPLAFAESPKQKQKKSGTAATEQSITVTGTLLKTTIEEGSAANYQPVKTLVVRADRANQPGSYVLNGPGHVFNRKGEAVLTAIKPGTHVSIYYVNAGDQRLVDHVMVD